MRVEPGKDFLQIARLEFPPSRANSPNSYKELMMLIKKVGIEYARKFNLGNYESVQIGCTIWADMAPGDDLDKNMHALWDMAKENVKAQAQPLVKPKSGNVNIAPKFLGLDIEQHDPYVTDFDGNPLPEGQAYGKLEG